MMVSFCPFNQFLDITNSKLESKHGSTKGFLNGQPISSEGIVNHDVFHLNPAVSRGELPTHSTIPQGDLLSNSQKMTVFNSTIPYSSCYFHPSGKKNTYSEKPGQLATSRRRHVAHFWCGSHSYKASLGLVCRWSRCWYMFKRGQGLEKYRNEYQWWFKKCSIWCDIGKMYKGIYVCKG